MSTPASTTHRALPILARSRCTRPTALATAITSPSWWASTSCSRGSGGGATNVRGAVLAGGAASRYGGRPKGLMEVGGRRILDRVIDAVAAATDGLSLLVANAPDAAAWRRDLHTIPDVRPGLGSLGGIYTAVTAGPGPVLAVAWDMPYITIELLRALVEESAGWDVFLPESDGRRGVEPLCAVYG